MGDAARERIPTLAEEWSLPVNEANSAQSEVPAVSTHDENSHIVTSEEVKKSDETTIAHESDAIPAFNAEETVENTDIPTEERTVATPTEVKIDEAPVEVKTDESPNQKKTDEALSEEKIDEIPASEENTESPEEQQSEEEADEGKPAIKIETAPADFRFPTTNQTRHCFTRYIEYHRCIQAKGEGAEECNKFAKYYRSLCPNEWIERWNEQRENGTFPGPL